MNTREWTHMDGNSILRFKEGKWFLHDRGKVWKDETESSLFYFRDSVMHLADMYAYYLLFSARSWIIWIISNIRYV